MAELLDDEEIQSRLAEDWERDGEEIARTFEFDDYLDGIEFAREVGELAEEEFHHPEMIVGYQQVEVRFTSHEEGGITEQDIEMAKRVNDGA
ncbi:putative pterin-4-alpha-carbinolamine dehydratase [Halalkalicoccus paucihalophilus]|uniref:Putative pterin-4-alpha-carbinolamine dehydratase n=1 Tax=Halalkalicoccus paucihalophilus TaxID=1008153 RepID=A0A151AFC4_9EURY|nr:4a-hydroxytetrahydrobiopterin dehydratase [Halalkalicoccus paucihalophilus]KYH26371.1 putative pterin-4-alpha-carbinolamine dehydratase [Halalkalicoccus paucihalophilus]